MDKFIAVLSTVFGGMWNWFWNLKTWVKVVIISVVIFGCCGSVVAYSINKRNKIIRENKRIMAKQLYQNEMLKLDIKKKDQLLIIERLNKKDKGAKAKLEAGRLKLAKLGKKQKALEKKRKATDKKTAKDVKAVDKMSVQEQIKKMNQVLGDTL